MAAVVAAVRQLGSRPLVAAISTTGLHDGGAQDLPLAMKPVYYLLKVPHIDKAIARSQTVGSSIVTKPERGCLIDSAG